MRIKLLALLLCGTGIAAADDDPPAPPPAPTPPAEEVPPAPPATDPKLPPINITITNNNNGNNSNTSSQTNDNKQTNDQDNKQDNTQTNTQTNKQDNKQDNKQTNTQTQTIPPPQLAAPYVPEPTPVVVEPPRSLVARYTPRLARSRWIALGVVGGPDGAGIRASTDLLARRAWSLGIAGTLSGDDFGHHGRGHGGRPEGTAVAYLAYTTSLGPVAIRAQLGAGVGTRGDGRGNDGPDAGFVARSTTETDPSTDTSTDPERRRLDLAPRAEAALLLRLPLGKRLGLIGGPVVTATGRGDVEKSMFTGLSYRF